MVDCKVTLREAKDDPKRFAGVSVLFTANQGEGVSLRDRTTILLRACATAGVKAQKITMPCGRVYDFEPTMMPPASAPCPCRTPNEWLAFVEVQRVS